MVGLTLKAKAGDTYVDDAGNVIVVLSARYVITQEFVKIFFYKVLCGDKVVEFKTYYDFEPPR